MNPASLWSRILVVIGSVAMLVGALDLMEGSLVILPGSGLVALGTFFGHRERRWIIYRTWVFILIAIGVGAIWGFTMIGGIGGNSGHSEWWELLVVPYLLGWTMGIWGPGSPRWLLALGILVGAFHLWLVTMILQRGNKFPSVAIALGVLGVVTIIGCFIRWMRLASASAAESKSV
jgi:hypothetical protein